MATWALLKNRVRQGSKSKQFWGSNVSILNTEYVLVESETKVPRGCYEIAVFVPGKDFKMSQYVCGTETFLDEKRFDFDKATQVRRRFLDHNF